MLLIIFQNCGKNFIITRYIPFSDIRDLCGICKINKDFLSIPPRTESQIYDNIASITTILITKNIESYILPAE